jgi:hypothetical protein
MSAAAVVALLLALIPGANGDQPTVSSLRLNADGSAVGAVTATRATAPAAPRRLRGFGAFSCTRRARSLHCVLRTVRRGNAIRVDYVAFTATTTTRTRAAARPIPGGAAALKG